MSTPALSMASEEEPDEIVWACPECRSTNVSEQRWYFPNTDTLGGEAGSYSWCDECDSELKSFDEIPRRETKEWKEQHAEVHGGSDREVPRENDVS